MSLESSRSRSMSMNRSRSRSRSKSRSSSRSPLPARRIRSERTSYRDAPYRRDRDYRVSAGAPLASVIISTPLVYIFKAYNHGISTIGKLKSGLNRPLWDKLLFNSSYLCIVCKTGIMTGIVSLTEGVVVGRNFSTLKDYPVDCNKEMMVVGLMNIIGSCTSCYVTTGCWENSWELFVDGCGPNGKHVYDSVAGRTCHQCRVSW